LDPREVLAQEAAEAASRLTSSALGIANGEIFQPHVLGVEKELAPLRIEMWYATREDRGRNGLLQCARPHVSAQRYLALRDCDGHLLDGHAFDFARQAAVDTILQVRVG